VVRGAALGIGAWLSRFEGGEGLDLGGGVDHPRSITQGVAVYTPNARVECGLVRTRRKETRGC
jgi:hypothetical protein